MSRFTKANLSVASFAAAVQSLQTIDADGPWHFHLDKKGATLSPAGGTAEAIRRIDTNDISLNHPPVDFDFEPSDATTLGDVIGDEEEVVISWEGDGSALAIALDEVSPPVAMLIPVKGRPDLATKPKAPKKAVKKAARIAQDASPTVAPTDSPSETADAPESIPAPVFENPHVVALPPAEHSHDGIPEAEPCVMCGTTRGWVDKKHGRYIRMAGGHCKKCYFNHVRPGAGGEGAPRQPRQARPRIGGNGFVLVGARLLNTATITSIEPASPGGIMINFVGGTGIILLEREADAFWAYLSDDAANAYSAL